MLEGGSLTTDWLLDAYRAGAFPMPSVAASLGNNIHWYSPDPRGIIPLGQLRKRKRLLRKIRAEQWQISTNQRFREVVKGCALPRKHDTGVWLTQSMQNAYVNLHEVGHAKSVEVWLDGQLVGGVYGVVVGGVFAAESMFSTVSDASKIALIALEAMLVRNQFSLLDIQWPNDHTMLLGATEIPRKDYLKRLAQAATSEVNFPTLTACSAIEFLPGEARGIATDRDER